MVEDRDAGSMTQAKDRHRGRRGPALFLAAALGVMLAGCAASGPSGAWDPAVYGSPGVRPGPDFLDPQFYGGIGL